RLAVGAEGQRPDIARMAGQARHFLTARRVPQPDGTVAARRGDARAVGVEHRSEDLVGMTLEDTQALARRRVPEADRAIAARRHEPAAVPVEGDGVDVSRMPLPASVGAGRVRGPKYDGLPVSIPAGEPFAVGAESEWEPIPRLDLFTGRDVRNPHRPPDPRNLDSHRDSGPVGAQGEGPHPLAGCHPAL